MKKKLFTLLACFTLLTAHAQTDRQACRISYATTLGTGLAMSTPSSTPFTWQVLGYYNLTDRWAVGAGTGLSFYEKTLIPLFGDVRFQLGKTRRFTPYAELGVGYAFAPQRKVNGGFFINPSIGVQYPLAGKMKLQLAVGYELQEFERLKTQTDNQFRKEFVEQLSHHSLSVRLGLKF
ncbi:MAG TPA: porin family protein [Bacteroides reticulotermitis]|nr:porin family protein [Bacteroides reticulotermitis]